MKDLSRILTLSKVHFWALCCLVLQMPLTAVWAQAKSQTLRQFHTTLNLPLSEVQNLFLNSHPELLTNTKPTNEIKKLNSQFVSYSEQILQLQAQLKAKEVMALEQRKQLDLAYQEDIEILSAEATYLGLPFSVLLEEVSLIPSYPEDFEYFNHPSLLENNPDYAHLKSKIEDLKLSVYMKNLFFSIANNSIHKELKDLQAKILNLKKDKFILENTYSLTTQTIDFNPQKMIRFLNQKSYGLCQITQNQQQGLELQVIEAKNKNTLQNLYAKSLKDESDFVYETKQKPFFSWFAKTLNPKFELVGRYKLQATYTYDINKTLIAINFDVILDGRFKFGHNMEKLWPNQDSQFKVLSFELTPKALRHLSDFNHLQDEMIKAKVLLPLFTSAFLDTQSLCLDY